MGEAAKKHAAETLFIRCIPRAFHLSVPRCSLTIKATCSHELGDSLARLVFTCPTLAVCVPFVPQREPQTVPSERPPTPLYPALSSLALCTQVLIHQERLNILTFLKLYASERSVSPSLFFRGPMLVLRALSPGTIDERKNACSYKDARPSTR